MKGPKWTAYGSMCSMYMLAARPWSSTQALPGAVRRRACTIARHMEPRHTTQMPSQNLPRVKQPPAAARHPTARRQSNIQPPNMDGMPWRTPEEHAVVRSQQPQTQLLHFNSFNTGSGASGRNMRRAGVTATIGQHVQKQEHTFIHILHTLIYMQVQVQVQVHESVGPYAACSTLYSIYAMLQDGEAAPPAGRMLVLVRIVQRLQRLDVLCVVPASIIGWVMRGVRGGTHTVPSAPRQLHSSQLRPSNRHGMHRGMHTATSTCTAACLPACLPACMHLSASLVHQRVRLLAAQHGKDGLGHVQRCTHHRGQR